MGQNDRYEPKGKVKNLAESRENDISSTENVRMRAEINNLSFRSSEKKQSV